MERDNSYNNVLSRVVFKFRDNFYLTYQQEKINAFFCENNVAGWNHLLTQFPGITVNSLFTSVHSQKILQIVERAKKIDSSYFPPNFLNYYAIDCPCKTNVDLLLRLLSEKENIELAYIESGSTAPQSLYLENGLDIFYSNHLKAAPVGINVKYAWNFKGGNGNGKVKFVDIEQGWRLDHKSIAINTFPDTGIIQERFQDHGTAVLGLIAQNSEIGETGITPGANVYVISQWRPDGAPNTADAIMTAIDHLNFGDIILLEAQVFDSMRGYKLWPVEIQEAIFQVIRLATAAGITVIEAAGNGNLNCTIGNDLDLFTDKDRKNVFDRSTADFKDSGAIMVAAVYNGEKHERIKYSNYGSRVDCFARGERIATSYTAKSRNMRNFSGTSCAAAIIAGVAISVQTISEENNNGRLSAFQMRNILGNDLYGTPSANGTIDKIGVMPDLKKIIDKKLMYSKGSKYFSDSVNYVG